MFFMVTFSWWQKAHPLLIIVLFLLACVYQLVNREEKKSVGLDLFYLTAPLVALLIGLFYTSEPELGKNEIVRKLSLFAFPLISMFKISNVWISNFRILLKTFVIGCFAGVLLSYFTAFSDFVIKFDFNQMFYTRLSYSVHTTFFSMYLFLAMVLLWFKKDLFGSFYRNTFLVIFSITSIMLLSRAGIIVFVLSATIAFIGLAIKSKWSRRTWLIYVGVSIVALLVVFQLPIVKNRVMKPIKVLIAGKSNGESSTDLRLGTWQSALELIKESPYVGYGSGETSIRIQEQNKIDRKDFLVKRGLNNAHNQYLNDMVSTGLIGLLAIFIVIFYPLLKFKRNLSKSFRFFQFMFAFNLMFDSILNSQSGVVFYSFFAALLFIENESEIRKQSILDS